ncbi:MAG: DUF3575 domain-containing protein [Bdellovibrionaceae bacterium]|nr:DUF3575 domain-containing protein [Pseudobdellovibrionaceae bacterium]
MKSMIKLFLISFLFVSTIGASALAQVDSPSSTSSSSKEGSINARISPLGLLIGYFNADIDFKLGDQWTLGPTFSYWGFDVSSSGFTGDSMRVESKSIGARANWYKNGVFKDSLFFSPIFQYVSASATGTSRSSGSTVSASASVPVMSALVGYHWFGQTLNMSLGAGLGFGLGSSKVKATDGTTTVESDISRSVGLALDFMIGIVF